MLNLGRQHPNPPSVRHWLTVTQFWNVPRVATFFLKASVTQPTFILSRFFKSNLW